MAQNEDPIPGIVYPPFPPNLASIIFALRETVSMHRNASLGLLAFIFCALTCCPASAQQWAKEMFETTEHNFGSIGRGADRGIPRAALSGSARQQGLDPGRLVALDPHRRQRARRAALAERDDRVR